MKIFFLVINRFLINLLKKEANEISKVAKKGVLISRKPFLQRLFYYLDI